jgi:hypothetical protein
MSRRSQPAGERVRWRKQEDKEMPLYLDEIYFNVSNKESLKQVHEMISGALKSGFPQGVTLKAGPWFSNEEAKVVLVLDIQDHSLTFSPFSGALSRGMVSRRRLSPMVDWPTVEKAVREL